MVASCGTRAMWYILPMILGRTYDMQQNRVGIDVYDKAAIDEATNTPILKPTVSSEYITIEEKNEKRQFLDVSGEFGVKISAGLLDFKGAGKYLRDTSTLSHSLEILIKLRFLTVIQALNIETPPLKYWRTLDRKSVGTHVVSSITYGGEVYASVNFVAQKSADFESIKAKIMGAIKKKGAFDAEAQGELEKVAKNLTSEVKMEIDYFANVPLKIVPTTLEGLRLLVSNFSEQVQEVNNGLGVPVCVELRPLSDFDDKFTFLKNEALVHALEDFNDKFNDLREAKSLLNTFVSSLPDAVDQKLYDKIVDFSGRLTETLDAFYQVIGNLDMEKELSQLNPARTAYEKNCNVSPTNTRYSKEIIALTNVEEEKADPSMPRGVYVRWGKRSCGIKADNNILDIGFLTFGIEGGIGAGTNFQCLPENPDLKLGPEFEGLNSRGSKLAGVRYHSMSVFKQNGKKLDNKVAPCSLCETPMRPTVEMFPAMLSCPGDWVQEYAGFVVSTNKTKHKAEFICVDFDPDTYEAKADAPEETHILPIKMGSSSLKGNSRIEDASLPCVVCSK